MNQLTRQALDRVARGFALSDPQELAALRFLADSLRWRDPGIELPDHGVPVLTRFKAFDKGNPHVVAYHTPNGWFLPQRPDGGASSRNRVFGVVAWKDLP